MEKRGAFNILVLRVIYLLLALMIVFTTYLYLDSRLNDTIFIGYVSREIGLNLDTIYTSPGGELILNNEFDSAFTLSIDSGEIHVKDNRSNREISFNYIPNNYYNELKFNSEPTNKLTFIKEDDMVNIQDV